MRKEARRAILVVNGLMVRTHRYLVSSRLTNGVNPSSGMGTVELMASLDFEVPLERWSGHVLGGIHPTPPAPPSLIGCCQQHRWYM